MSLIVREGGSVPLPEDLVRRFGIHEGSRIELELGSSASSSLT